MLVRGPYIIDDLGRTLLLRGCNLGGSSKIPVFRGDRNEDVSFTGRPFPLDEAEEHFERLRRWGFSFLRFVITWEALEHAGPGIYDEAYLAYLRKLFSIAEKKGISLFMDPHQDVWSRWTGGDGAPAWTLEKIGLNPENLEASGAALCPGGSAEYPPMIWPVNYSRYGAATLFTLFFGGNAFAPDCRIEGESAQDWLQERYIAAMRHCFRRLKNSPAVAGWGTMNEPHPGFIGYRDISGLENYALALGPMPSPFQAMAAASGIAVKAPVYMLGLGGIKRRGWEILNPRGVSLFKAGFECPWKQAGVWTVENGEGRLLKKDHFAFFQGGPVRFTEDFLKPFMRKFIERMKEADRNTIFFVEGIPQGEHPSWGEKDPRPAVNAFHWYDGITLFTRQYRPWLAVDMSGKPVLGEKRVAAWYSAQLEKARAWTREKMGNMPAFLGEFGLPFNLNHGKAFKTGDYRLHEEALSRYYDAVDKNLLHSAIWNYTADNTHDEGDHWNGEDLSIFSEGQARALGGWLRPYPMATAGTPLSLCWNRKTGVFNYRFQADPSVVSPTEIFAPGEYFGAAPAISLETPEDGEGKKLFRTEYLAQESRLYVRNEGYAGITELSVRPGA